MPSRSLALAFLLALCPPLASQARAQASPAAASRPTLVVFITVDQLRPDYFQRYDKQLTGGLARLYHGGAFMEHGYQDHAITETAPGHSETMSGRFPRSTGITSNSNGVGDPQNPLLGGGGSGASPFRFRGTVLTDWMRVADPRTRALSISRKDRGAILPMGRVNQEVYWYASDGRFTTSTYYHDTLPDWVNRFNSRKLPQSYAGKTWDLLLPASEYPEPDSVPVENGGRDIVFPHVLPDSAAATARRFASYPFMDEVTVQAALAGLQELKLGLGPQPDVLAISLSTTDAVGHSYGPDSREIHDQFLRLDRYLGVFLDSLYRLRDSTRIVVALTADHAVASFPQVHAKATGTPARFVDIRPVLRATVQQLAAAGAGNRAVWEDEGMVFVDSAALERANVNTDSLLRALSASLRSVPGVQRVDAVSSLASMDTTRDYVARRWYHMIPPDVPAKLVVTMVPYAYHAGVNYATHGTPHDYDAHVPILFYGPSIRPGHYTETARVVDMAPTLAHILGVPPLERLDGRVLTHVLR